MHRKDVSIDMKRVLLKLSGEALAGNEKERFETINETKSIVLYNEDAVVAVAEQVKQLVDQGIQVGIVIGGGNIWRGRSSKKIERTKADQIGMMATIMNCLYVSEIFRSVGMKTKVYTPFVFGAFTEVFSKDSAVANLNENVVTFFAGGTGHPYFSTDTATVLRAIEIEADVILLAKSIDGIYDSDPAKNPDAKRYDEISMKDVVDKRLGAIDMTSAILCQENAMPMLVFDLNDENSIVNTVNAINSGDGSFNGTKVTV